MAWSKSDRFKITAYFLMVILTLFAVLIMLDRFFIKQRIAFITAQINQYQLTHHTLPANIDFIPHKKKLEKKDLERESWCAFSDSALPGWGYCYYGLFQNDYVFVVKGYYSSILYEPCTKGFVYNSPKYTM
ncbi:hypothetical protein [Conchiformibius steedae]|nr:hypothetical protein [Conchiformibius steedae]QMT33854.1 hypothetical protein H3L98_02135 [Conchiformibius steedae]